MSAPVSMNLTRSCFGEDEGPETSSSGSGNGLAVDTGFIDVVVDGSSSSSSKPGCDDKNSLKTAWI